MMKYKLPGNTTPKRPFLDIDNDNTFMPPILSSYSIALLNEGKSPEEAQSPLITGIYELDFPHKSSLKQKLSQHFDANSMSPMKEMSPGPKSTGSNQMSGILSNSMSNNSNLSNNVPSNNSHISHTNANNSATFNSSHLSLNSSRITDEDQEPSARETEAVFKPTTSSVHTIKRRSIRRLGKILGPPQRARRISLTAQDVQDNERVSEERTPANEHIPHESHSRGVDSFSTNMNEASLITTPKTQIENEYGNSSSGQHKNGTLKHINPSDMDSSNHMNSNHNFHSNAHSNDMNSNSNNVHSNKINSNSNNHHSNHMNPEFNYNISTNPPVSSFSPVLNQNFKKSISPAIDILSKQNEVELRRRIEHQKLVNQENFNKEPMNYNDKTPQKRIPLKQIPISDLNAPDDNFRKPKLHKPLKPNAVQSPQKLQQKDDFEPTNASYPSRPKSEDKRKKTIIINGNEYEKLELLGRGGSSKVYKVKSVANTRLFAIKKVLFDQFDESCVKGFKGEIDLLLRLKHSDRVVKLVDHAIGEGSIYLVMECGDLDLAHVFQNRINIKNLLDLSFVKYHAIEILKCVKAVHEAEIVHSDLKPANFLFVRGMLKIIDFGIANAVPDHTANIYRESQIGTPNYMAPEALIEINQSFPGIENQDRKNTWKVGKPSDVWSCGCIIYQMIYGKPPYGGYSGNQRIMAIINPQVKIQFPTKGLGDVPVPKSAIELMKNCLARNPNERWTIDQCLTSDFLEPKVVSETFIRDLVHLAVNYGYNSRANGGSPIPVEVYDTLVDSVIKQIKELNYG